MKDTVTLPEIHARLWELTQRRQNLYRRRMREIRAFSEQSGPFTFLKGDPDDFKNQIEAIEVEEDKLWDLKRRLLSIIHRGPWSWLSPVIHDVEPTSVPI